ncbi:MAG: hypothetical protein IT373_21595 [Polyangiaceae bacterium]|nr:hypothetical protein [Polyangiaceae bacterium]
MTSRASRGLWRHDACSGAGVTHVSIRTVVLFAPLSLAACSAEPPPQSYEPKPVAAAVEAIRDVPVTGTLGGQPFAIAEARVYVDERPEHEKTDIVLSAGASTDHCGDLGPLRATTVWLRRTGAHAPESETVRFAPGDDSPWEAHYEVFQNGNWSGNGHAAALVAMNGTDGRLSVCFGDATGSCVEGTFSARRCPIRIDSLVRGSPALEALPHASQQPSGAPPAAGSARP